MKTVAFSLAACLPLVLLGDPSGPQRARAGEAERLQLMDVFELEYASDPRISPDGRRVVFVRHHMDVMRDRARSTLWSVAVDGTDLRPLTSGQRNDSLPRWSPDGKRLAYVATAEDDTAQLFCRWMDTGDTAQLAQLQSAPGNLVWSPDGRHLAFTMHAPEKIEPFVKLPEKPKGAQWAEPAVEIGRVLYRHDGDGYAKDGWHHLFVLPAEGGTPRQLTDGPYHHTDAPSWTADGKSLIFSANRHADWQYRPRGTEIFEVTLEGELGQLTDSGGPNDSPVCSPDGRLIAFTGFEDRKLGYQLREMYLMNRDGSERRLLSGDFQRDVTAPVWSSDGTGLFFQFDDRGNTRVARMSLSGKVQQLADHVGGTTLGRPYSSGSFSVADDGTIAFTQSRPSYPADVAIAGRDGSQPERLTRLNEDLFGHKTLGGCEEIWYESSLDGRKIQGWIVKPPGFDPAKKYPLILEIHGGPFANYGHRFAAEIQLYAAAGYVVLYTNPRGSTGYGQEFAGLIHHNYPGEGDFQDLMSGVDELLRRGYVDESRLFVTGGSGGGVLTAWLVGKTDRFRAAVSQKPVINWYSFVLTSDVYPYFTQYWFSGPPWEHPEQYLKRSPLSQAGNVTTPTMLITGEADYRTPISESEQFYQALRLRKIDSMLVRIPGASHAIVKRPSRMVTKVSYVLEWFETHGKAAK